MQLDHVAIRVSNINKSLSWYRENFNCDIIYEDRTWAMIKIGDTKIAMTLGDSHPPHIAFKIEDMKHFPCIPSNIKEHRDKSKYYYQSDPDGNVIEWINWPD